MYSLKRKTNDNCLLLKAVLIIYFPMGHLSLLQHIAMDARKTLKMRIGKLEYNGKFTSHQTKILPECLLILNGIFLYFRRF